MIQEIYPDFTGTQQGIEINDPCYSAPSHINLLYSNSCPC